MRNARRLRRPAPPPSARELHIPAPIGGLNTIDVGSRMPDSDAILLTNMVAAEYGLRSRLGFKEWCTGLTGNADNTVRSILPFTGSKKNGSTDRLFAATSTGFWDVSASSAAPTHPVVFGVQTGDAGWASCCVFNTPSDRYLVCVDEENGLYYYRESDSTWITVTQGGGATQISNVNPANFCHVTVFKNRLWFVQRDTTLGWYLGLNSVFGAANSWDFGPRMRAGGPLVGLYNWSDTGGSSLDTFLVGISGGGDVVIYAGTDPASVLTFGLKGCWFVGGVPYGRRVATDYGGDLLILSSLGIMSLSKLVQGNPILDRTQYATAKISNLFNNLMGTYRTRKGWSLRIHPTDNTLIVTVPVADGQPTFQLAMALANRSWSQYGGLTTSCTGLPMLSADAWGGDFYFGTHDGRVCKNTDYIDNVALANPNSYSPVQFECITSFQDLDSIRKKRVSLIRPRFLSQGGALVFGTTAKYDYDFSDIAAPGPQGPPGSGTWDNAQWDQAVWGGDYAAQIAPYGAVGMGVSVAIGVRGNAVARTSLIGFDIIYDQGGVL